MQNTTTIKYPIKPVSAIDDNGVLNQLPMNIRHQLGTELESGFHLFLHRRDLIFEGGVVQYTLGADTAIVELN